MFTIKVVQMYSPRSGRPVANQFEIHTGNGVYFQSYDSIIVFKSNDGRVTLDKYYWNYSRTTAKYRNEFLNEGTQETQRRINAGEYTLADLN